MVYRVKGVNPEMIKWAREDAGYSLDDLPEYLSKAKSWESGEITPTWADLRKLAKKYNRPPIFYLMSKPPSNQHDGIIEFRSNDKVKDYSPELRLEIRKAKFRRNSLLDFNIGLNFPLLNFSKNVHEKNNLNVSDLSSQIRDFLGVDLKLQSSWSKNSNGDRVSNHSTFLYEWKEIFFDLGILVFETEKVAEKEMSGLSLYFENYPIILLNGKNSHNRRIFTLMHELAHLFMGGSAICDIDKHNKKETFCNKVAAEVLVPLNSLTRDLVFYKNGNINSSKISNYYGVSKEVCFYRLFEKKFISEDKLNKEISVIEEKNREKMEKKRLNYKKSKGGGLSLVAKKKKYEGKPFMRFLLNAYENELISPVKFMKTADISIDYVNSLNDEMW